MIYGYIDIYIYMDRWIPRKTNRLRRKRMIQSERKGEKERE